MTAVPSIFTRIIDGEVPGVFVWRDPQCVAFLSINPMHPGHTLVVPREEVDHWIDLDPELNAHLFDVARQRSVARRTAPSARAGSGCSSSATRSPTSTSTSFRSTRPANCRSRDADPHPAEGSLEAAAEKIRAALRDLGAGSVSE